MTEREKAQFYKIAAHIVAKHEAGEFVVSEGCKVQDVERFIHAMRRIVGEDDA